MQRLKPDSVRAGSQPTISEHYLSPATYRSWRATEIGVITERLEQRLILELAGDVAGRAVLDVGCGDGELAIALASRGALVAGIDASAAMIGAARQRAKEHGADIHFQVAIADKLPFAAERFDLVTAVTILCFVEDAAPVFQEVARVLRPGGRFVIGELGKWSSWAAVRRIRAWLRPSIWRHGRFRTPSELRHLAASASLTVEQVRGAVYYPRSSLAARWLSRWDGAFSKLTTIGAGFVALSASKPIDRAGE